MFDFDVVTGPAPTPERSTPSPAARSPSGRAAVEGARGGGKPAPDRDPVSSAASSGPGTGRSTPA